MHCHTQEDHNLMSDAVRQVAEQNEKVVHKQEFAEFLDKKLSP